MRAIHLLPARSRRRRDHRAPRIDTRTDDAAATRRRTPPRLEAIAITVQASSLTLRLARPDRLPRRRAAIGADGKAADDAGARGGFRRRRRCWGRRGVDGRRARRSAGGTSAGFEAVVVAVGADGLTHWTARGGGFVGGGTAVGADGEAADDAGFGGRGEGGGVGGLRQLESERGDGE